MKKIFFLLLLIIAQTAAAQKRVELLKAEKKIIEVQFDLAKNIFKITSQSKTGNQSILSLNDIQFSDKEIQIKYTHLDFSGTKYYRVRLEAALDGVLLPIVSENILGSNGADVLLEEALQERSLIWTNLVEDYIQLQGVLQITLYAEAFGSKELPFNVDCGVKPQFTNRQQLPYLGVAIVGAGSLLAGQQFRRSSEEDYALYLSQETAEAAEPFFLSANDKHHKELVFTYSGAALLAGDLIWYLIRQRRYKRRLKTYQKFCQPTEEISLRPALRIDTQEAMALQAGLRFQLQF